MLPLQRFQALSTLFSKSLSPFPHGTCLLSVSNLYVALNEPYHLLRAPIPRNVILRSAWSSLAPGDKQMARGALTGDLGGATEPFPSGCSRPLFHSPMWTETNRALSLSLSPSTPQRRTCVSVDTYVYVRTYKCAYMHTTHTEHATELACIHDMRVHTHTLTCTRAIDTDVMARVTLCKPVQCHASTNLMHFARCHDVLRRDTRHL